MAEKIIALCNLKGGVGKTTLSVNLACALAAAGLGPLVVADCDSQGTTSEWAAGGHLPVPVVALPLEDGQPMEGWITRVLNREERLVVLDLPPHLSGVVEAACGAADLLLIPCGASVADISASAKTLDLVNLMRQLREGAPQVLLVPSRIDRRSSAGRNAAAGLAAFGEPVAEPVGARQAFAYALGDGTWVGAYQPNGAAHREITALARRVAEALGV